MAKYYLGRNKEITANSLAEAKKIGVKKMKASKYIADYIPIYDSKGNLYGEIGKDVNNWIGLSRGSHRYALDDNGEIKRHDSKRPYSYRHNNRMYRFKTPSEARKSTLSLNKPKGYGNLRYEVHIYKETKTGARYPYETVTITKKGEAYTNAKRSWGYELCKVEKNGSLKKVW